MSGLDARDVMPVDAAVARLLVAAGREAAWPATPDLRSGVLARIEAPEAPDLRPGVLTRIDGGPAHPGPAVRTLRALGIAAILVILVAGLAAGLGFDLPGLDLGRTPQTPATSTSPLNLGSPIPIADALVSDRPRVLAPAALPPPDEAYELGADDGRIVSLAWRAAPGDKALRGTDTSLTLMAIPGTTEPSLIQKAAGPDVLLEPIDVNGDRGWWITGAPHEIMVLRPDGDIGVLRAAVVGDTLVFSRDGTLYRLESALGKERTLEIARSLR